MRIAIVGGRNITDSRHIYTNLNRILEEGGYTNITVVSGGAKGVDSIAEEYAKDNDFDFILFEPYHLLDKSVDFTAKYFFIRNKQIVNNCDMLIAFWDGKSKGTEHAIHYAQSQKKRVIIVKS